MKRVDASYLHQLKPIRRGREPAVTTAMIASCTMMSPDHVREIDNRKHEPYLDEAVSIAWALNLPGIMPMISPDNLADLDLGVPLPSDVSMLRAGARLPLSVACRVTLKLGLTDPMQLTTRPIDRELWTMTLERSGGICPICRAQLVGEQGHLPACLPDNLYGARDHERTGATPLAKRPGKGRRSSDIAKGLRTQREARGLQAQELARMCGEMDPTYLSKLETGKQALTLDKAKVIAAVLGCDEALLYVDPNSGVLP